MEVGEARRLLAVDATATEQEVERAFAERLESLESRRNSAPTAALSAKFQHQIDELRIAREVLGGGAGDTGHDDVDLPVARPSAAAPPVADQGSQASTPAKPASGRVRLGESVWASPYVTAYRATDTASHEELIVCVGNPIWDPTAAFEAVVADWRRLGPAGADLDFTTGELDQRGYLAFRALDGGLLRSDIDAARKVRRLKPVEPTIAGAAMLARRVSAALPHLRAANLKPETIWRTAQGHLIPIDFAPAPEDISSEDFREQAAVGGVIWEMLTNRPVEDETAIRKLRPEVSPLAAKALEKALEGDPGRRHASLEALANGLKGDTQGLALADGVSAHLSELSRLQIMAGAGGAVLLAVLAATYSSWKSHAPWQVIFDKQEATRLAGVVKSLTEHSEAEMTKVTQDATVAAAEVDRLQEKMQGNGGAAYDDYLPRYIEAAVRKAKAEQVRVRFEAAAATDLESGPLKLAEATDRLSAGDNQAALTQLKSLQSKYAALAAMPGQIRQSLAAEERAAMARLSGAWDTGDCTKPSQWRLAGTSLNVTWPDKGVYQERVMGFDDGVVYTIGVLPQNYAGHVYGYTVDGRSLIVEAMGRHSAKMTMKRCS